MCPRSRPVRGSRPSQGADRSRPAEAKVGYDPCRAGVCNQRLQGKDGQSARHTRHATGPQYQRRRRLIVWYGRRLDVTQNSDKFRSRQARMQAPASSRRSKPDRPGDGHAQRHSALVKILMVAMVAADAYTRISRISRRGRGHGDCEARAGSGGRPARASIGWTDGYR